MTGWLLFSRDDILDFLVMTRHTRHLNSINKYGEAGVTSLKNLVQFLVESLLRVVCAVDYLAQDTVYIPKGRRKPKNIGR